MWKVDLLPRQGDNERLTRLLVGKQARMKGKSLSAACRSIRDYGFGITIIKIYMSVQEHWFDFRYGIDTCSWSDLTEMTIDGIHKPQRRIYYQPGRILPIRKMLRAIRTRTPSEPVLVDFGSGKGRVLIIASEFGFKKVRGVEFARELCEVSKRNWAAFQARTGANTDFKIVAGDAANYEVGADENVFFMFNPFAGNIVASVLDNITASLRRHPRKILIVYYLPAWRSVIEKRPEFERVLELNYWGYCFDVFSNCGCEDHVITP